MVRWKTAIAGLAAGIANGLLGAGGGMILIPLLHSTGEFEESEIFPASVAIILPLCVVSLSVNALQQPLPVLICGPDGSRYARYAVFQG